MSNENMEWNSEDITVYLEEEFGEHERNPAGNQSEIITQNIESISVQNKPDDDPSINVFPLQNNEGFVFLDDGVKESILDELAKNNSPTFQFQGSTHDRILGTDSLFDNVSVNISSDKNIDDTETMIVENENITGVKSNSQENKKSIDRQIQQSDKIPEYHQGSTLDDCKNIEISVDIDVKKMTHAKSPDENSPSCSHDQGNKQEAVNLFTTDKGPFIYKVKGNVVTQPIIPKNLPKIFECLPVFGQPKPTDDIEEFQDSLLRNYVGQDINDEEFDELAQYCSVDNLHTGREIKMSSNHPMQWVMSSNYWEDNGEEPLDVKTSKLQTLKRLMKSFDNKQQDQLYAKKLKYRSMRCMRLHQEDEDSPRKEPDLEPGKDMLFCIRIYKPYVYKKDYNICKGGTRRHSLFVCDMVVLGRLPLTALRDRIVCENDLETRFDVSATLQTAPGPSAKEIFPSGFLFINNVFYVDRRAGCLDHSAPIRAWARAQGLGEFPHRDMGATTFDQLVLRLGHPEVYVHQGQCEHVFTVSEVRLLGTGDPLHSSAYPCHTRVAAQQIMTCTMCSEFGAKWVVTSCERVPFDPVLFCDTCIRQYLYIQGRKVGEFKAYRFRANEINVLKPQL